MCDKLKDVLEAMYDKALREYNFWSIESSIHPAQVFESIMEMMQEGLDELDE